MFRVYGLTTENFDLVFCFCRPKMTPRLKLSYGCGYILKKIVRSGEELEEVMEDIELLRLEKRRRKAKLKFFGLDVPNDPDFNKEGLADVISLRILLYHVVCLYMYIDFDYQVVSVDDLFV